MNYNVWSRPSLGTPFRLLWPSLYALWGLRTTLVSARWLGSAPWGQDFITQTCTQGFGPIRRGGAFGNFYKDVMCILYELPTKYKGTQTVHKITVGSGVGFMPSNVFPNILCSSWTFPRPALKINLLVRIRLFWRYIAAKPHFTREVSGLELRGALSETN